MVEMTFSETQFYLEIIAFVFLISYVQWIIQSLLNQTKGKNPLVHKG